ncbi:MAG: hypothetical protein HY666_03705 [Chloroflexi bacterium]|nr:hypothetical protein [Chloroflexota bacterium]
MYSSLIGKIEKAKRYAEEPGRVTISDLKAAFRGEHDTHSVSFRRGEWLCSCEFFTGHGTCSHSMALQRILDGMLPIGSVVSP